MTATSIKLTHMTFEYEGTWNPIFKDVNLHLDTSWKLGLIGRNGRGKTTLLNLFSGHLQPTSGTIDMPVETESFPFTCDLEGKTGLEYCLDAAGPFRKLDATIQELIQRSDPASMEAYGKCLEAYEALDGYNIESKLQREVQMMGMDPDLLYRPAIHLSGGERTKLQIIALFLKPSRFLLIDEPTNHLDLEGRTELALYLRKKTGFILVSHDQAFVDTCCDHVLSINKKQISLTKGNFSTWEENKLQTEKSELAKKEQLQKEMKRLEKAAKNTRNWSGAIEKSKIGSGGDKGFIGAEAARMMKRALQIEVRRQKQMDEVDSFLQEFEAIKKLEFRQNVIKAPAYMKLYDIAYGYGDQALAQKLNITIEPGDRIWVRGKNGSGKSTLMNLLAGDLQAQVGQVWQHTDVRIARAWQDMPWTSGSVAEYVEAMGCDETGFIRMLAYFDMDLEFINRQIETLSEGERKKLDIARAFSSNWELYLWDEPLNYMDYNFRVQLEQAILKYQPTLVFVEHDQRFSEKVATKILNLDDGTFIKVNA